MNIPIPDLKSVPELKAIILAAFPGYRRHKAYLYTFSPININSYWSGDSRSEFALVNLATMSRHALPTTSHPYFDITRAGMANAEDNVLSVDHVGNVTLKVLPEGFALVKAGTFCGKPATACIYINAANLAKFLPAAKEVTTTMPTGA